MNRAERRKQNRRRTAISKELVRMEKPEQYELGFQDGGKSMTKTCYACFVSALANSGMDTDRIVDIMRDLDDRLFVYAGNEELQQDTYDKAGIMIDFDEVFSNDRIYSKSD